MQKKAIALAVAGLISGGALAQSNIVVTGLFDASLYLNRAAGSSTYGVASSTWQSSNLGFRGTEDLGNGLQAFFNLKENLGVLTGASGSSSSGATATGYNNYNAAANIGLTGGFGTLTLGRQATPVYSTFGVVDTFNMASGGIGNQWGKSNLEIAGFRNPLTGLTTAVASNNAGGAAIEDSYVGGISYATPVLGGFQARIMSTFGNGVTGSSFTNNGIIGFSASYNNGPVSISFAHDDTHSKVAATAAGTFPSVITTNKTSVLGGSYKIGELKLAASWFKEKYDASLVASHDNSAASLGATYQTGPWLLGLEYTAGKDDIVTANKANTTSFLADYRVSKRTDFYVLVSAIANKGQAIIAPLWDGNFLVGTPGSVLDARNKTTISSAFGIRHAF